MDFYRVIEQSDGRIRKKDPESKPPVHIKPEFLITRPKDFMVRSKEFYAVWDEENNLWSTNEFRLAQLIDNDLFAHKEEEEKKGRGPFVVKSMMDYSSNSWKDYRHYVMQMPNSYKELDSKICFTNSSIKKTDYISKCVPYALEEGKHDAWDEILHTLYKEEEARKIEWAIGSIVSGDSVAIQKFLVFYGSYGKGKSTILNIIQKLFEGYYTTFEAKALTSQSDSFSTEVFKKNPLVAIQHDGDLSRIEDNSKLNSIISHEEMTLNEKNKPKYTAKILAFLFMATNKPVKITDAKSGILRRLIDVSPSGEMIPPRRYHQLMSQIEFELGAIAYHCQQVYFDMGKYYYNTYQPFNMMIQTDYFYNFVEENFHTFKEQDGTTIMQAYEMYKTYCDASNLEYKLSRPKVREELKNYFREFSELSRIGPDNKQARSCYFGFMTEKFGFTPTKQVEEAPKLLFEHTDSLLDITLANSPAQYATDRGTPKIAWRNVETVLYDLDTTKLHYVALPENHIIIDFDLKNKDGEKDRTLNLEKANEWPATYGEYSKSGGGVHLHYIYDGDVSKLSSLVSEGIEVKTKTIRRMLSYCNNIPIAHISSGIPTKGDPVVNFTAVKSERKLRELIKRNLRKEIHGSTAPSIDFILKLLTDAYNSGMAYDLTEMRPEILAFANNSTNQAAKCLQQVAKMPFQSKDAAKEEIDNSEKPITFFDVEVFPNLFILGYKHEGPNQKKVFLVNPKVEDIERVMSMKLVGFNCRRYDNHIIYAAYLGYSTEQLYDLSKKIIGGSKNCMFREARNLSYTDILDFSSKKQSLKKFEIELGINHMELDIPWDEPVPKELWPKVIEYNGYDIDATEAVFNARKADFTARKILADLSGLSVNQRTETLAAKIIFGDDPNPQEKFNYVDLSEMFPGYKYERGKSTYLGEVVGEGGLVRAKLGVWGNAPLLDVKSMHPSSIIAMNLFGPYTKNYADIYYARLAIKEGRLDDARKMLDGRLVKYLEDASIAEELGYAFKIVLNIVYGLTVATFASKFKDPRNIDNIVAKRGALFMMNLKKEIEDLGYIPFHIKTDSIKIADGDQKIIDFVMDYGKKYGYEFEHEATYDKIALINKAVYLAVDKGLGPPRYNKKGKYEGPWHATGAQFIHPYVFKTLGSKEPIDFKDMCEVKTVKQASIYLDLNEQNPDEHNLRFIGGVGEFCPVKDGSGGGRLMVKRGDKLNAISGSKGWRWMESRQLAVLGKEDCINEDYFRKLVDDARAAINTHADVDWFFSDEPYDKQNNKILPF